MYFNEICGALWKEIVTRRFLEIINTIILVENVRISSKGIISSLDVYIRIQYKSYITHWGKTLPKVGHVIYMA